MEDLTTVITLLTIAVILLSIVIIALIAAVTIVLIKVNRVAKNLDATTSHIASATKWLNPTFVFTELANAFRRK